MANRSDLISAKTRVADRNALYAQPRDELDPPWIEVASAANVVPIPWICCFRPDDLRQVRALEPDDGEEAGDERGTELLACTSLQEAIANLEAARPLFEVLAANPTEGHSAWTTALAELKTLPHPWLFLSATEVVEGPEAEASFAAAFTADDAALPHLRSWGHQDPEFSLDTFIHFEIPKRPPAPTLTVEEAALAARFSGMDPGWLERRREWLAHVDATVAARERENRTNLESYVVRGYRERKEEHLRLYGTSMPGIPFHDWEHFGDGDLDAFGRDLLRLAVRTALRDGRFDPDLAARGFSACFLGHAINMHFVAFYPRRIDGGHSDRLLRRECFTSALGFVLGQRAQAEQLVRAHHVGQRNGNVRRLDSDLPAFDFVQQLMERFLELAPAPGAPELPEPFAHLLACAFDPSPARVLPALLAACDLMTQARKPGFSTPDYEQYFPLPVMLLARLRAMRVLPQVKIEHPVVAPAFMRLPVHTAWQLDPLVERAHARMQQEGFSAHTILERFAAA